MSDQKDNIGVVQRYVDDKKVGITFNQTINADGEDIIAEVFVIGGDTPVEVNSVGFNTSGGLKGEQKTVFCDFSTLTPGDNYSLKFRTAESGVLARAALVIFAEDAFTTQTLAVTDSPEGFQPISARLTEIAELAPDYYNFITGNVDSTGWEAQRGDTLRGRMFAENELAVTVEITLGDQFINIFTGTIDITWLIPNTKSFWLVVNRSPNGSNLYLDGDTGVSVHNSDPFLIEPDGIGIVFCDGEGSAYINTNTGGVTVLDEDDMVSDSDTAVPTQQSVKAYVDANAGGGGAPRTVNPKWELNLTSETYLIDGEGAFSIAISSDSEVGTLSFKRRIKGNVFDDNSGSYFTLSEINAWIALRSGDEWEIGCFPNTPDFDPDNDTINELIAVGCILEFTQL